MLRMTSMNIIIFLFMVVTDSHVLQKGSLPIKIVNEHIYGYENHCSGVLLFQYEKREIYEENETFIICLNYKIDLDSSELSKNGNIPLLLKINSVYLSQVYQNDNLLINYDELKEEVHNLKYALDLKKKNYSYFYLGKMKAFEEPNGYKIDFPSKKRSSEEIMINYGPFYLVVKILFIDKDKTNYKLKTFITFKNLSGGKLKDLKKIDFYFLSLHKELYEEMNQVESQKQRYNVFQIPDNEKKEEILLNFGKYGVDFYDYLINNWFEDVKDSEEGLIISNGENDKKKTLLNVSEKETIIPKLEGKEGTKLDNISDTNDNDNKDKKSNIQNSEKNERSKKKPSTMYLILFILAIFITVVIISGIVFYRYKIKKLNPRL